MAFELIGGRVALDFLNTVGGIRPEQPEEKLRDFGDLVAWAREALLIDGRQQSELTERAALHPRRAQAALEQARALREAFFAVLSAAMEREPVPQEELVTLNTWIAGAMSARRLRPAKNGRFELAFQADDDLLAFLRPVALSAADVLAQDLAEGRVHVCDESAFRRCGWLFVDDTKNHTRRFCSMRDCGNRAKQRRHRERARNS